MFHSLLNLLRNNKKIIILLSLFFLSRIIFINSDAVFFDSAEYLHGLVNPSFITAILSGHIPLHAGYIVLLWPIYHLSFFLNLNPTYSVVLFQIFLSGLTVLAFYKIAHAITNEKVALLSAVILSLTPLFWITNVTIMMEMVYICTFIFSVNFLTLYLQNPYGNRHPELVSGSHKIPDHIHYAQYKQVRNDKKRLGLSNKKHNLQHLVLSSFFLAYSLFTHLAALLYLPVIGVLLFMSLRSRLGGGSNLKLKIATLVTLARDDIFIKTLLYLGIGILVGITAGGLVVAYAQNISLLEGINIYLFGKLQEKAAFSFSFTTAVIYIRNWIIPLLHNNTNLIVVLAFVSLISLFQTNKKPFALGVLWIIPSFIANQWWDSVFFGRHALLTSFGLAFLAAHFVHKYKFAVISLIFYLLITTIPILNYLAGPIPYLELSREVSLLPKDSLYIESHFARPQTQEVRQTFNTIYVDEPGWQKEKLKSTIETYLKEKRRVFISTQALSEPYGLYCGPYLHSLSLSYKNPFVLQNVISEFTLKEFKTIKKSDNLVIYEVVSTVNSPYPAIPNLKHSARRLDYYDIFTQLWFRVIN